MDYIVQIVISSLSLGSFYALGALGIGLLFGVLRLINFAHGDFIAIGGFALIVPSAAVVAVPLILDFHWILLIICVIGVVIVFALASYFLLFRQIQTAPPAVLMIASVALSFSVQNLIIMIYGGRPKAVGLWPDLTGVIELSDKIQVPILQLVIVAVTWTLLVFLTLFLRRTPIGVQMRAAAEDFRMARMLGVNATRVIALAFVLSGALAGIMALMYHTQTGILNFRGGVFLMLYAFIATVIGGMGSLVGAVVGGYVVGIFSTVLIAILPEDIRGFRDVFVFALVVIILLARPQGLVPTKAFRERV
jgi:branched-chain amino acid transport system permease protein